MKKIILFGASIFIFQNSIAQNTPAIDKAADKMCDYIKANMKTANIKSKEDATGFFAKGFMKVCSDDITNLLKEAETKEFNEEGGRKLGYKIGLKLVAMCPEYMELMSPAVDDMVKEDDAPPKAVIDNSSVEGYVKEVFTKDYTYLNIKNSENKIVKLIWLENFEGAEKVENNPALLIGKHVHIEYTYRDLYYSVTNSFVSEKVITSLAIE